VPRSFFRNWHSKRKGWEKQKGDTGHFHEERVFKGAFSRGGKNQPTGKGGKGKNARKRRKVSISEKKR